MDHFPREPALSSRALTVHLIHEDAADYAALLKQRAPQLDVEILEAASARPDQLAEIEILLVSRCPPDVIAKAKRLRWLQCSNAGVDFLIPLRNQLDKVIITNARGIHGDVMADYAMATITMHVWDMAGLIRDQAARRWQLKFVPALAGSTLLVVGLGAIGEAVAQRARASGMRVIGVKRRQGDSSRSSADEVHTADALPQLLPRADFVVLVLPSTPLTQKMFGRAEFASMKSTAFLVQHGARKYCRRNGSRGRSCKRPAGRCRPQCIRDRASTR